MNIQSQKSTAKFLLCIELVVIFMELVCAIYLPWIQESSKSPEDIEPYYEPEKEENQIYRYYESLTFRYDEDILRYLKVAGRQVMIWRCRNAVKPYWNRLNVIPFVDLYCSVIGFVSKAEWQHSHHKISTDSGNKSTRRYDWTTRSHNERGTQFTLWTDFGLRMHNVTRADSGAYLFEVFSPDGELDQQVIFVDVSSKCKHISKRLKRKRKKKKKKKNTPFAIRRSPIN